MKPVISIVIPVYNKEKCIENTLKSVFNQTFEAYEIILINDGSTDASEAEILKFSSDKINYFKTENKGVSRARNFGIEKASGTYIAFLDADDIWFPNHLENLMALVNNYPNCGIYAANYEFYYTENKIIKPKFKNIPTANWHGIVADYFTSSLAYHLVWTSAVLIPKSIFQTIGNFDEKITLGAAGEDTDLWMRIALHHPIAFNTVVSAHYVMESAGKISSINTKKRDFSKLDKFKEEEKNNLSLHKFLNVQRTIYALKHKLVNDRENFNYYYSEIDQKHLDFKTKVLLKMPNPLLIFLYNGMNKIKKTSFYFYLYTHLIKK